MTTDSPLARQDPSRRLIKPHSLSYINDLCSVLVEERERLEREVFTSAGAVDPALTQGMIFAVNRLLVVESKIVAKMAEWNKQNEGNEE